MDNTALSRCITKKKRCNIGHKYHANPSHVWSACALPWLHTAPEPNVTFANTNPTCRREAPVTEVTAWRWIRNAWTKKCPHGSLAEGGSWTHLSAHCTVDGEDDKALDRVKDGKEDLGERRSICLLIIAHCFAVVSQNLFFKMHTCPHTGL